MVGTELERTASPDTDKTAQGFPLRFEEVIVKFLGGALFCGAGVVGRGRGL